MTECVEYCVDENIHGTLSQCDEWCNEMKSEVECDRTIHQGNLQSNGVIQ
jgi:hypothetical protein